jgi:hypothetical protein
VSGIVAQNVLDNSGLIKAPSGGGAWNFISKQTASSSSSISFTSGIDSTYKEYLFTFNNIHPASDQKNFEVNFRDGGSDFDAVKQTQMFLANHAEGDSFAGLAYQTALDLANSSSYQPLTENTGADNDQGCSGTMHLFDPSSTTFCKFFIAHIHSNRHADAAESYHTSGYCNTTAAIDGADFRFSSGNIDSGEIFLFGLSV